MAGPSPLSGLVLSGGYSQRMQRDKAALVVDGQTQLARAVHLLQSVCADVFISVRADQQNDPTRAGYAQIVDQLQDIGPAAGILAALGARTDHAWLVVAVDLPLLDANTLTALIAARDPTTLATAYRSHHDGLPEPLCAIWEPASSNLLDTFLRGGRNCPRKFLISHPVRLIDLAAPDALANVNTPEEYASTVASARRGAFA